MGAVVNWTKVLVLQFIRYLRKIAIHTETSEENSVTRFMNSGKTTDFLKSTCIWLKGVENEGQDVSHSNTYLGF